MRLSDIIEAADYIEYFLDENKITELLTTLAKTTDTNMSIASLKNLITLLAEKKVIYAECTSEELQILNNLDDLKKIFKLEETSQIYINSLFEKKSDEELKTLFKNIHNVYSNSLTSMRALTSWQKDVASLLKKIGVEAEEVKQFKVERPLLEITFKEGASLDTVRTIIEAHTKWEKIINTLSLLLRENVEPIKVPHFRHGSLIEYLAINNEAIVQLLEITKTAFETMTSGAEFIVALKALKALNSKTVGVLEKEIDNLQSQKIEAAVKTLLDAGKWTEEEITKLESQHKSENPKGQARFIVKEIFKFLGKGGDLKGIITDSNLSISEDEDEKQKEMIDLNTQIEKLSRNVTPESQLLLLQAPKDNNEDVDLEQKESTE